MSAQQAFAGSARQEMIPSFDCSKASTKTEHLICSDKEVAEADAELARLYKQALASAMDKEALKRDQQTWIKSQRDVCTDTPCLLRTYQGRLSALGNLAGSKGTAYTGTYESVNGVMEILQLPNNEVRFKISATWSGENTTNIGEACGEVALNGDTAIFSNPEKDCVLVLRFSKNRAVSITQKGSCEFGLNVDASGLYKLTESSPPQLTPCDN
jgi:uncharacterized protein